MESQNNQTRYAAPTQSQLFLSPLFYEYNNPPSEKQKKKFQNLISIIDQLSIKMVSTAFKATFQTDEQAQAAISSFKSDLINYLRNTTQLDFTHSSLPATTRLPSDTPAKPNAKYFKNIKDQMLRQYHMFFGTKALFQSIVGHENAYKITNEIYKVVGQQHFFSGYAVQQFYEEDEIEMQSITCDTIDFTPKQNKKKK